MEQLFTQLKKDTLHQHQRLENSAPFTIFHSDAPVPVPLYQAILRSMYHFHLTVSEMTQGCVTHLYDQDSASARHMESLVALLNSERVLQALQDDLFALNQGALAVPEASPIALPEFHGLGSSAIAGMYVWLGSSMGANLISRRLHKQETTKDAPSGLPTHYYDMMADTAKHWVNFKQRTPSIVSALANHMPNELIGDENNTTTAMIKAIVADANLWFAYLIALGREAS